MNRRRKKKEEIHDFMADINKEEQTLGIRNAVLAASALRRALASRSLVPDACCGTKRRCQCAESAPGASGLVASRSLVLCVAVAGSS